jgi:hypothetical protein
MTSTATSSFWPPAPRVTPRSGLTSEKSQPQATVMWRSPGSRLLVGSVSIQPEASPQKTETQACEASAPVRRTFPGGATVSRYQAPFWFRLRIHSTISSGFHFLLKCVQTLDLLPITPETIAARDQVIPAETTDYPLQCLLFGTDAGALTPEQLTPEQVIGTYLI